MNSQTPWRYEIKCGPDDEASHAWIYDDNGEFIAVMKIHKAKQIVDAMNARSLSSPNHADTGKVEGDGWMPTHRHKKRGSTYQVIAEGRLQVDGDLDNERVVIYRGEDGQHWVRPSYEFNDGRFEALVPASEGEE